MTAARTLTARVHAELADIFGIDEADFGFALVVRPADTDATTVLFGCCRDCGAALIRSAHTALDRPTT